MRDRLIALFGTATVIGLIFLYVREFQYLHNAIQIEALMIGSLLGGLVLAAGLLWWWRGHFTPWQRHLPEISFISLMVLIFSPLMGSLLNRLGGRVEHESFVFQSEQAIVAKGYGGLIRGEVVKPIEWRLQATRSGVPHLFVYKHHALFPFAQPGTPILLPVRQGLLGVGVMEPPE
jgi:hypothetical protein